MITTSGDPSSSQQYYNEHYAGAMPVYQQAMCPDLRIPYPQSALQRTDHQLPLSYPVFPFQHQYQPHPPPLQPLCVPLLPDQRFGTPMEGRFSSIPDGRFSSAHQLMHTSALDSCQQISHVLQCYQQGGEDAEFVRKAIESLVKKLKDKRVELDALITAVTSSGKQPTSCVTIQRSLDGRLQVAGRKGVPHVVYARIWRWPNVNKNELVKSEHCQIANDHQDYICINPYHYERVVSNGISPLDMKSREEGGSQMVAPKTEYQTMDYATQNTQLNEQNDFPLNWMSNMQINDIMYENPLNHGSQQSLNSQDYDLNQVQLPNVHRPLPQDWCTITYYELDSQVGESFKVPFINNEIDVDGGMDPHGEISGRMCLGALSNVHRGEASEKCRIHIGDGIRLQSMDNGLVFMEIRSRKPVFIQSGYLDYCSGVPYGNQVHRYMAESGRITSADGPYVDKGLCTAIKECPVLQPKIELAYDFTWRMVLDAVTVFDLRWAFREMQLRIHSASEAVRAQAAAVAGVQHPQQMYNMSDVMADSGVDGMRSSYCTLSVSFLKGWGTGYPRNSIKETPCWIEVQLHRPLQLLDYLLKNSNSL